MSKLNAVAPALAGDLSAYQKAIKRILEVVAELEPDAGSNVSETAIFIRTVGNSPVGEHRQLVSTALNLISDRGFARREHTHWAFRRRFGPHDVAGLLLWNGRWVPAKSY